MSDLGLINANLWRKPVRTILLLVSIFIAFFIFVVLGSVHQAFYGSAAAVPFQRLVTLNKISFTETMPVAYYNRVVGLDGVRSAAHASWFGGYYQDPRNMVQTFAVTPEAYLDTYPELVLPAEQREAWLDDRNGILVGRSLADRFEWEVGDQIPLLSNIWRRDDGTYLWDVRVSGVFDVTEDQSTSYVLMRYDTFNEPRSFGQDTIGWMIVAPENDALIETLPDAIDTMFANSPFETETSTEEAFGRAFLEQAGNIGLVLIVVMAAAFFTILLIVGNTMVMAVRERTREIGVMKALGFPSARIFRIVLSESILLAALGGLLGLAVGGLLINMVAQSPAGEFLPGLGLSAPLALATAGIAVALGLVTGAIPALNAMRLRVVEALGRG